MKNPRWIRERKRFDREHLSLVDRHIYEMTDQIIRTRLDIMDAVHYLHDMEHERYMELRERMDNK